MTYCIDTKAPDNYQCFIEQQNNTKFEKGKSIESLFQNVYYVLIICTNNTESLFRGTSKITLCILPKIKTWKFGRINYLFVVFLNP